MIIHYYLLQSIQQKLNFYKKNNQGGVLGDEPIITPSWLLYGLSEKQEDYNDLSPLNYNTIHPGFIQR